MISKAQKKLIQSLKHKKYRKLHQNFVVEGNKSILDFIKNGFSPIKIFTQTPRVFNKEFSIEKITQKDLSQISFLKNPQDSLAIFAMKKGLSINLNLSLLILDDLQDPGNLGTIIRTADWFGIKQIVCSENTVDCYNPKTIQSSMGSLSAVQIIYTDLQKFLDNYPHPIYGTFMQGKNVFKENFPDKFSIIIGNEGNGIKPAIEQLVTNKITIPKHPDASAESLNAAVAAGIIMSAI